MLYSNVNYLSVYFLIIGIAYFATACKTLSQSVVRDIFAFDRIGTAAHEVAHRYKRWIKKTTTLIANIETNCPYFFHPVRMIAISNTMFVLIQK